MGLPHTLALSIAPAAALYLPFVPTNERRIMDVNDSSLGGFGGLVIGNGFSMHASLTK